MSRWRIMPIRQTQSYLKGLFAQRGIIPQRRLGQNFLIDLNIHDLIVKTAELSANDVILEVGPGAGALTTLLAAQGATVISVEVDPAMARLTSEAVAGLPGVRVLNLDALAGKHVIHPIVLDNVRSALAAAEQRRFKVVANLPYHVATPLITNLLVHPELCPALHGGDRSARDGRSAVRRAVEPRLQCGLGGGAGALGGFARQGAAAFGLLAAAEGRIVCDHDSPQSRKASGAVGCGRVSHSGPPRFLAPTEVLEARAGGHVAG